MTDHQRELQTIIEEIEESIVLATKIGFSAVVTRLQRALAEANRLKFAIQ